MRSNSPVEQRNSALCNSVLCQTGRPKTEPQRVKTRARDCESDREGPNSVRPIKVSGTDSIWPPVWVAARAD